MTHRAHTPRGRDRLAPPITITRGATACRYFAPANGLNTVAFPQAGSCHRRDDYPGLGHNEWVHHELIP